MDPQDHSNYIHPEQRQVPGLHSDTWQSSLRQPYGSPYRPEQDLSCTLRDTPNNHISSQRLLPTDMPMPSEHRFPDYSPTCSQGHQPRRPDCQECQRNYPFAEAGRLAVHGNYSETIHDFIRHDSNVSSQQGSQVEQMPMGELTYFPGTNYNASGLDPAPWQASLPLREAQNCGQPQRTAASRPTESMDDREGLISPDLSQGTQYYTNPTPAARTIENPSSSAGSCRPASLETKGRGETASFQKYDKAPAEPAPSAHIQRGSQDMSAWSPHLVKYSSDPHLQANLRASRGLANSFQSGKTAPSQRVAMGVAQRRSSSSFLDVPSSLDQERSPSLPSYGPREAHDPSSTAAQGLSPDRTGHMRPPSQAADNFRSFKTRARDSSFQANPLSLPVSLNYMSPGLELLYAEEGPIGSANISGMAVSLPASSPMEIQSSGGSRRKLSEVTEDSSNLINERTIEKVHKRRKFSDVEKRDIASKRGKVCDDCRQRKVKVCPPLPDNAVIALLLPALIVSACSTTGPIIPRKSANGA